jgi:ABC-type multidrug transport system ATPase subunit
MVTANDLCDRVAFLVDGVIAALDTPRSLRMSHGRRVVRLEVIRDGARATQEFAAGEPYFVYLTIGVMTAALSVVVAAHVFERRLLTRA